MAVKRGEPGAPPLRRGAPGAPAGRGAAARPRRRGRETPSRRRRRALRSDVAAGRARAAAAVLGDPGGQGVPLADYASYLDERAFSSASGGSSRPGAAAG